MYYFNSNYEDHLTIWHIGCMWICRLCRLVSKNSVWKQYARIFNDAMQLTHVTWQWKHYGKGNLLNEVHIHYNGILKCVNLWHKVDISGIDTIIIHCVYKYRKWYLFKMFK